MGGGVICGAKKRAGGACSLAAGWGTLHPGLGKCKFHGGSTPSHIKAAANPELSILLGQEIEIDPVNALLWCIRLTAGEVKFWTLKIYDLNQTEWVESTMIGKQLHLYGRQRQESVDRLARYSQMAMATGLAERAIRLAEAYGDMLAVLIQSILTDLYATEGLPNHWRSELEKRAAQVVPRRLLELETGPPQAENELVA